MTENRVSYNIGDIVEYHEVDDLDITGWYQIQVKEITHGLPTSFDFLQEPAKSKLVGASVCIGNDIELWSKRFRSV